MKSAAPSRVVVHITQKLKDHRSEPVVFLVAVWGERSTVFRFEYRPGPGSSQ